MAENPDPTRPPRRFIMFADVCRSTTLYEQLGDKPALELVTRALNLAGEIVRRHGGTVRDTMGDEVLCTFEQASQALDAAWEMHLSMEQFSLDLDAPLAFRIGLNHGEIVVTPDNIYGDAVNVGSRLAGQAKAHQTILSEAVVDCCSEPHRGLVRELGEVWIRGKTGTHRLFELLEPEPETAITEVVAEKLTSDRAFILKLHCNGKRIQLTPTLRQFVLGRSLHCDLSLEHPTISREHGEIQYRNGRYVYVDKSTNGTRVLINGQVRKILRSTVELRGQGEILTGHTMSNTEQAVSFTVDG